MLIEFPKSIGKSRDKSYPTDQQTSSILVPTAPRGKGYINSKFRITNKSLSNNLLERITFDNRGSTVFVLV